MGVRQAQLSLYRCEAALKILGMPQRLFQLLAIGLSNTQGLKRSITEINRGGRGSTRRLFLSKHGQETHGRANVNGQLHACEPPGLSQVPCDALRQSWSSPVNQLARQSQAREERRETISELLWLRSRECKHKGNPAQCTDPDFVRDFFLEHFLLLFVARLGGGVLVRHEI